MKIDNNPKKYTDPKNKQSKAQQGIHVGGRLIPYTWLIGIGGVIVMVVLFAGVMGTLGDESDASTEPDIEEVADIDEIAGTDEEPEVEEDVEKADRMWDNYIDESAADSPDENATEDEGSSDETEETPDDTEVDVSSNVANDEEMVAVIKDFLTAYQIYGPADTAQEQYDRIYPYVTEELANTLVPNRGTHEAGPSIDVTHELVDVSVDAREGVDNDYVATIVYTREAMNESLKYTDVYTIRTEGDRVSSANIRSSTWE